MSFSGTTLQVARERNFENSATSWGWHKVLELEEIENYYAENKKFTIEAHLTIKKMNGIGKEKLKYFDEFNQKHWDVILSVDGHKFYLQKALLASQCTYFESLLFGGFKESGQKEIELKEVDHEDFKSFLELILGESAVDDTNIDGVLPLADMFDAPTAIRRCGEFLLEKSNWSLDEKVQLAERYHLKDLMIKLQQVSKEKKKEELEDVIAKPVEQSPKVSRFLWIRTHLVYLNYFLLVSVLIFTFIILLV